MQEQSGETVTGGLEVQESDGHQGIACGAHLPTLIYVGLISVTAFNGVAE